MIGILRKNILMIVGILFFVPMVEAQQIVRGQITDATDGMPVKDVSIFIANTTIGTTSDEMGNYSITISGNGSFEIVVYHVSYKSDIHKINKPQPLHIHDVELEINELSEEIVVTARSNYYQSDVDLFWNRILGVQPSENGIEVLNPDKVYFYHNRDDILFVSCKEPIEIINHQMGYRIKYVLDNFQHNYRKNETTFSGMPHFEELIPKNNLQKNNWEKKRQDVYSFSFTHFLRALYRKRIHEEGFLLIKKDARKGEALRLENILQFEEDVLHVNIEIPLIWMCFYEPLTDRLIKFSYYLYTRGDDYPIGMDILPQ